MSNYNIKLIALSIALSYFSLLLTFSSVSNLFTAAAKDRKKVLAYSAVAVGTSLWVIQFINFLAFPIAQPTTFALQFTFLSWLSAILLAMTVLNISSKKSLTLLPLFVSGGITGVIAFVMFYFSMLSMQIQPEFALSKSITLLAVLLATALSTIGIMMMFFIKNLTVQSQIASKSIFALLISLAIMSCHLLFSTTIQLTSNAQNELSAVSSSSLLEIAVALGFICLFLVLFIIAIFYENFSSEATKFKLFDAENLQIGNHEALIDTLTQLPNRRAFMQHLELAIKRCERNGTGLAIAFIDADNFKQINDALGHQAGDQVLQKIATRLVTAVRGCDEVARIGGDEFVAIIEGIEDNEDYIAVAERMVNAVHAPCTIDNVKLNLSVSIGVAMHNAGNSIEQLINAADTAMYRAKKDGKDQFRFFDAEIALAIDELLEIQYDLKNALANDELKLHYQIKVNSVTREPEGAEALLRWEHPVKGLLYPADFMLAADRFGLSHAICDWVIEESCKTLEQLKQMGIPYKLSVNISHQQMLNENLVSNITDVLHRHALETSSLIVEMTEYAALKNQTKFLNQLNRFKQAGIKVTLDDFGTYSSSLTNLQKWQVDELKLDPSFTDDIETNKRTHGVIQAVIELAHALDLNVIAEGVENENQRKILTDLGCDEMQGYFISRPLPEERFINLAKNLSLSTPNEGRFFFKEIPA